MELKQALAICEGCARALEAIPESFYFPADEHIQATYEQLDEAIGQLQTAVKHQEELLEESRQMIAETISKIPTDD